MVSAIGLMKNGFFVDFQRERPEHAGASGLQWSDQEKEILLNNVNREALQVWIPSIRGISKGVKMKKVWYLNILSL